jgi:hypothetical protein
MDIFDNIDDDWYGDDDDINDHHDELVFRYYCD